MSDLISRSALIEIFSKNSIFEKVTNAEGKNVLEIIKEQPTAYDVDKELEQIETKILGNICIGCGYLKNNVCTYKGSNCGVSKPMYEDIKKVFAEIKEEGADEYDKRGSGTVGIPS